MSAARRLLPELRMRTAVYGCSALRPYAPLPPAFWRYSSGHNHCAPVGRAASRISA
jgi:hypothetical protein